MLVLLEFDKVSPGMYGETMPERRRLFLGIDCASPWGGVALFDGFRVVGSVCMEGDRRRPFQPLHWMDQLFSALHEVPESLAAVGVTLGPGMFTGLRVGLSVAKGLAFSLGIPLYTLTSLEALALCLPVDRLLCPLLDARRGQFYAALYRWFNDELEPITDVMLLSKDQVLSMKYKVLFLGPGLAAAGVEGVGLPLPTAAATARFAFESQRDHRPAENPAEVLPMYIRVSDAEANKGIRVV